MPPVRLSDVFRPTLAWTTSPSASAPRSSLEPAPVEQLGKGMRALLAADGEDYEQDRLPIGDRDLGRFPTVASVPPEGGSPNLALACPPPKPLEARLSGRGTLQTTDVHTVEHGIGIARDDRLARRQIVPARPLPPALPLEVCRCLPRERESP
jgi:hypothetical protein